MLVANMESLGVQSERKRKIKMKANDTDVGKSSVPRRISINYKGMFSICDWFQISPLILQQLKTGLAG